jgi:hypothetical protein
MFSVVHYVRTIEFLAGPRSWSATCEYGHGWTGARGLRSSRGGCHLFRLQTMNGRRTPCGSSLAIDPGVLSVDSGRIRYVLKEKIGKIAAYVEPFRQGSRSQKPSGQVPQPRITGGDEFWHVNRGGQPEAP